MGHGAVEHQPGMTVMEETTGVVETIGVLEMTVARIRGAKDPQQRRDRRGETVVKRNDVSLILAEISTRTEIVVVVLHRHRGISVTVTFVAPLLLLVEMSANGTGGEMTEHQRLVMIEHLQEMDPEMNVGHREMTGEAKILGVLHQVGREIQRTVKTEFDRLVDPQRTTVGRRSDTKTETSNCLENN